MTTIQTQWTLMQRRRHQRPKATEPAKRTSAERRTQEFSHSKDGLAFYRIHKLMHAMTRPKLSAALLKTAGLKIADGIEFDLRVNFVVFVDDLDRCLPEKAVENWLNTAPLSATYLMF